MILNREENIKLIVHPLKVLQVVVSMLACGEEALPQNLDHLVTLGMDLLMAVD